MSDEETKAFRSLLRQTWINTIFERDKSVLTVSSGGIGLLLTLANIIKFNSLANLFLFGISLLCFIIAVISAIWIFSENKKILECQLKNQETKKSIAPFLDKMLLFSFVLGILLTTALALRFSVDSYQDHQSKVESNNMTEENREKIIDRSLDGISNIRPEPSEKPLTNSFIGIESIAPTSEPSAPKPDTTSQGPSTEK